MGILRAVIFDMDGVIIDSEPIHYQVNKDMYRELGIEVTDKEYESFIGSSNRDVWEKLKKKHKLEEVVADLIEDQENRNIHYLKNNDVKPIEGVVPLLDSLKEEKVTIGLASSSTLSYIKAVLEKFSIIAYFDEMVSGANMERGKPYPDIFIEITRRMNINKEEAVVIEDSENGVLAAKRAGLRCIGLINPSSGNQDLSEADLTVDSLKKVNIKMLTDLIKQDAAGME
ncbi:MAG: HAD family hydrolase [Halanaerobiaceae bacterium]